MLRKSAEDAKPGRTGNDLEDRLRVLNDQVGKWS